MPRPSISELKALSVRQRFSDVSTEKIWGQDRKDLLYEKFHSTVSDTGDFSTDEMINRAYSEFLLFLADNGGSEQLSSTEYLKVVTVPVGGGQPISAVAKVTYDNIIDDLKSMGAWYTNRRMLIAHCEEISALLESRGYATNWSNVNGMPPKFYKFSFPGAEYCRRIDNDSRHALWLAKEVALGKNQTREWYNDKLEARPSKDIEL